MSSEKVIHSLAEVGETVGTKNHKNQTDSAGSGYLDFRKYRKKLAGGLGKRNHFVHRPKEHGNSLGKTTDPHPKRKRD